MYPKLRDVNFSIFSKLSSLHKEGEFHFQTEIHLFVSVKRKNNVHHRLDLQQSGKIPTGQWAGEM